jgi:hypothetical protein
VHTDQWKDQIGLQAMRKGKQLIFHESPNLAEAAALSLDDTRVGRPASAIFDKRIVQIRDSAGRAIRALIRATAPGAM